MSTTIYVIGLAVIVVLFFALRKKEPAERQDDDFKTTIGSTADALENDLPAP